MQDVDAVVADKAFDVAHMQAPIRDLGAQAIIPPRANRKEIRDYDVHHYKSRNLIERFFARIKQIRRIAPATTNSPFASRRSSPSPQPSSGSRKVHRP
jgi:transposase